MLRTKLAENLGADGSAVLLNVRLPKGLLDRELVLGSNIEQGQVRLAAKSLTSEYVGKDDGPISMRHRTDSPERFDLRQRRF